MTVASSPDRPAESPDKTDATTSPATSAPALLDTVVAAMGGTHRAGQHEMTREVVQTMAAGGTLLAEAGTGTGKSLGYLVPGIEHAVRTGRRVLVSTATLALQRQLVARDLPVTTEAMTPLLPRRPTFALLKGWHHYACVHKVAGGYPADEGADVLFDLDAARDPGPANTAPARTGDTLSEQVLRLREWVQETSTGDRDELDPGVSDRAWRQVSVTAQECLGQRCPMLTECFPERARASARGADVVVTNHAMLGIAAAGHGSVLPEHDVVVVDEAHELADRVTSAASVELSVRAVDHAARLARRQGVDGTAALMDASASLAAALVEVTEGRLSGGLPGELAAAVAAVRDGARTLLSSLKDAGDNPRETAADPGKRVVQAALTALFDVSERIVAQDEATDVLWASRRPDDTTAVIHAAPLDVAPLVRFGVLSSRAAVLTSATLALGGAFDVVSRSFGLQGAPSAQALPARGVPPADQETTDRGTTGRGQLQGEEEPAASRWRAVSVGSPFDYAAQGVLYIAQHLPRPGRDGTSEQLLDELVRLLSAAGGRTLGLFSSRRSAERAAAAVRERTDLPVLCQGEDQLPVLVRRFVASPDVSLFGSLSLWQGVDVPGDSCQLVVIDRIPFPRPDDPVVEARSRLVASRGGNAFLEVSAAHAALLLAQGAGRLVRSVDDRGVVAVLDPRLATARYGAFLRSSLPGFWPTTSPDVVTGVLARLTGSAAH